MSQRKITLRPWIRVGLTLGLMILTLFVWEHTRQVEAPAAGNAANPWTPAKGTLSGSEAEWLYRARILHQGQDSIRNPRVIFLGDSLTENWRFHGRRVWQRYYGERRALNLGIWGDKIQHLLWRLREYPIGRFDPEVVVILIGINNISSNSPEDIARGVTALVRVVHEQLPGARILLMGLLPGIVAPGGRPPEIEHVNEILQAWAQTSTPDLTFLNISDAFLTETGHIRQGYLIDQVHLSERGYEVWAESIEPTLARLLDPEGVGERESERAGRTVLPVAGTTIAEDRATMQPAMRR